MELKVITLIGVEKNKLLILKRALHDTMFDLWEFPGGKVDADEKLEDSAKREVISMKINA